MLVPTTKQQGKMSSYLEKKSIKIIEFSGKDKDWKIWSRKFLAQASYKGYRNLLTGTEIIISATEYDLSVGELNADEKKTVRLWNLGERALLSKLCRQEGMGIVYKYTALCIPQQNERVKRQFTTSYS